MGSEMCIRDSNDSEPVGDITMTSDTTAIISNLQPNQEYTVSVTAVIGSCSSDCATKNFIVQASNSMFATSENILY